MNLGIVTSTVVGGILLMGILMLNTRMTYESDYTTMHQITKSNINAVVDLVEFDFRKIGYNAPEPEIETADSTTLTFKADIGNDGSVDRVTWEYKSSGVSSTENPNDQLLVRVKNGNQTDITQGVTEFDLTYFDDNNQTTTNPSDIKAIKVYLEVQSPAPIDGEYVTSTWEKRFVPWNLQQ